MKTAFVLVVLASAFSATAVTIPKVTAAEKRDTVTIYYCEHTGFDGKCSSDAGARGECVTIPWSQGPKLGDKISSLDTYGNTCTFWEDAGCQGPSIEFNGRIGDVGANWNDRMSSWKCN